MKPYQNREIDEKFNHLHDSLQEKLDLILEQTTKTNGRVTKVENDLGTLKVRLYIIASILGTFLVIYFPEILNAMKVFI